MGCGNSTIGSATSSLSPSTSLLRVVHVNDVYLLDQLPKLKCLVDRMKKKPGKTIVVMSGDFIMPSLLSGVDKGAGMIDVLNQVGLDYVCFGNHECDIPNHALIERIKESKFTWINSNMRDFAYTLPEYVAVDAVSQDGSNRRKVGLVGVCVQCEKTKFGGAAGTMEVPNACVSRLAPVLKSAGCAALLPLTHQDQKDDVALANMNGTLPLPMPVVFAGHDHDESYSQHSNCWVMKAGADALKADVVELVWDDHNAAACKVSYRIFDISKEQADPALKTLAARHLNKVLAMEHVFFTGSDNKVSLGGERKILSSERVRFQPTTVGAFFATAVRTITKTDCCLLEAASIKGETTYTNGKRFNMASLRRELPYDSDVVTVKWTGQFIKNVIEHSRASRGLEIVYFQQVDDRILFDAEGKVTHLAGAPLVPTKTYSVSVFWDSTFKYRGNKLIKAWTEEPANAKALVKNPEAGKPIKVIMMEYLARLLWEKLPPYDEVDLDKKGGLSAQEVETAYIKTFSAELMADGQLDEAEKEAIAMAVKLLMSVLETDGDSTNISRKEYESLAKDCIDD